MRRAMCKPCKILFKHFAAHIKELNNYLPLFLGSSASKNMPSEEPNNILLHAVPNGWEKQAYLQVWDFKMNSHKATCDMFKRMKVAEKVYKGGKKSKTPIREYDNHAIHSRKRKGG